MACRASGIQRILARYQSWKHLSPFSATRNYSSAAFGRLVVEQYSVAPEHDNCSADSPGWRDWNDDFTVHFSNGSRGASSDEAEERSPTFPGLKTPAHRYWDRRVISMGPQNAQGDHGTEFCNEGRRGYGIGSAQIAKVGLSGRGFSGQSFGCFARASEVGGVTGGIGNSWMSRSFSSVPVAAEDKQIPVEGEQLDSMESGLARVTEGTSAVDSLPDSGALSEVAVAAADSSYPTAFIQFVIDGVHVSTGLPWWLSIVATTAAIRVLVLPILVYQMKATARLTLMRPELEKLTNHIKESGYDPEVVEENQKRMKALFQKYKTSPLSPILGAFVQAPIFMCFFFAIRNMAEKMESFKEGGALWFTDLSTPDDFFIMPVLSGAFFLLTVELGATDGMQGQPMLGKMKMFLRGLAVLLVPLTASFPKALFCYWLTANVFSIIQAAVFKQRAVKAALGIPDVSHLAKPAEIPVAPIMTFSQPPRLKGGTIIASSKRRRP